MSDLGGTQIFGKGEKMLSDIKEYLEITDDAFDQQLLRIVPGIVATLIDLGVEELKETLPIGESTPWPSMSIEDVVYETRYKQLIYSMCKREFDPPANDTLRRAQSDRIEEQIFRLGLTIGRMEDAME